MSSHGNAHGEDMSFTCKMYFSSPFRLAISNFLLLPLSSWWIDSVVNCCKERQKCSIPSFSDFKSVTSTTLILSILISPFLHLPSSFRGFCCPLLTAPGSIKRSLVQCHLPPPFQRLTQAIPFCVQSCSPQPGSKKIISLFIPKYFTNLYLIVTELVSIKKHKSQKLLRINYNFNQENTSVCVGVGVSHETFPYTGGCLVWTWVPGPQGRTLPTPVCRRASGRGNSAHAPKTKSFTPLSGEKRILFNYFVQTGSYTTPFFLFSPKSPLFHPGPDWWQITRPDSGVRPGCGLRLCCVAFGKLTSPL